MKSFRSEFNCKMCALIALSLLISMFASFSASASEKTADTSGKNFTSLLLELSDVKAPSPPQKLKASNIQWNRAILNWSVAKDNVGVTSYLVYQGSKQIAGLPAYKRQFTVTGLKPLTAYSFTVKAKDQAGNISKNSNIVYLRTIRFIDKQAPTRPSNVSITNLTATSVTLTWRPSTDNAGVSHYVIYQHSKNRKQQIAKVPGNRTTHTLSNMRPGTHITLSVVAKDAGGNSSPASSLAKLKTYTSAQWKNVQEKKLRQSITLSVTNWDVNSVGGITISLKVKNNSPKTIKYIKTKAQFINDVGDYVFNEIGVGTDALLTGIGPIYPGNDGFYEWDDPVFYSEIVARPVVKITSVEFMDGTIINY